MNNNRHSFTCFVSPGRADLSHRRRRVRAGLTAALLAFAADGGHSAAAPPPETAASATAACSPATSTAADFIRLGGEADLDGDDTPIRVHLQLCGPPDHVEGRFSNDDGSLQFAGHRRADRVEGVLSGRGTTGNLSLVLTRLGGRGSFAHGDRRGKLRLGFTTKDAKDFLEPTPRIDLPAEAWEEDLDALVDLILTKHGSPFDYTPKSVFMARVAKLRADIPNMSGALIAIAFRELVALIGDGHSQVDLLKDRPVLPLEFYWFEDGVRVVAAPPSHPELLGAKLLSINGVPAGRVLDGLKRYSYQHEAFTAWRRSGAILLTRIDMLDATGVTRPGKNRFIFEGAGGKLPADLQAGPARSDLIRFRNGYPLWQRNPQLGWWEKRLPDGSVYVDWRNYNDLDKDGPALLRELDAHRPPRLLIDLRDNGGGDFNVGRRFVDAIRKRPWLNRKGKLYVLVGRRTFSAAMTNAVDFQKTTAAVLVGETIAAKPNGWQESREFILPNSGIGLSLSIRYYAFLPGASEVRPPLYVAPRLSDWSDDLDAAVRRIFALPIAK